MPRLQPVDETYFATAPQQLSHTWAIRRPAAEVWSELTGEQPLHFCRGLDIHWTSQRPLGVGSTRQAKVLGGVLAIEEHFFIWEEGHRHAFYGTHVTLPLFTSLAEDYIVEDDGAGGARVTWRVAITPTTLGRPGTVVNRLLFASFFSDVGRYFAAG